MAPAGPPLVYFHVSRGANGSTSSCPFGNESVSFELFQGSCVWLTGNSGLGKTTLVRYLAGLASHQDLKRLDIQVDHCDWNPTLPPLERCGMLFQQTTLLDALTVAGNLAVALQQRTNGSYEATSLESEIKYWMELVGLDYARDANKKPTQLSGGMARRASLALQLAQHKHVIVLDEPFTGLDRDAAISVAKELWNLRRLDSQSPQTNGTSHHNGRATRTTIVLISHEPEYANIVLYGPQKQNQETQNGQNSQPALHNVVVTLTEPVKRMTSDENHCTWTKPNLFGISWWHRFVEKWLDYTLWSFPLIALTFCACGLAISMLSCDILARLDVKDQVMEILDEHVKPMLKYLTGQEDNAMAMIMVKMKVQAMLQSTLPQAKATLYAVGMAHLFCLEIGPLLTALLLCGRIGGSYAGKVATLQATQQSSLLQTMGISPLSWTLFPALAAASLAAPFLTILGTGLALILGGIVGPTYYGIGTSFQEYQQHLQDAIFPPLRVQFVEGPHNLWFPLETTFVSSNAALLPDLVIELATYPPCFLLLKSLVYMALVLTVAQTCAALRGSQLTPRGVPHVITSAVVVASLLIIVADWAFSQLWLMRH